jgi:hypothetical protein
MPHLPRDIGEQIATHRSRRRRFLDLLRRWLRLPPVEPKTFKNPGPPGRDRV